MKGFCKKEGCGRIFEKKTRHCRICEKCKEKSVRKQLLEARRKRPPTIFLCSVKLKDRFIGFIGAKTKEALRSKIKRSKYKRDGCFFCFTGGKP